MFVLCMCVSVFFAFFSFFVCLCYYMKTEKQELTRIKFSISSFFCLFFFGVRNLSIYQREKQEISDLTKNE